MAKISALENVAAPDGTETVVILKAGVAKRTSFGNFLTLIAAARDAALAAITAAKDVAIAAVNALIVNAAAYAAAAAASAGNAASIVGALGENLFGGSTLLPEYRGSGGLTAPAVAGTNIWQFISGFDSGWAYNAVGRFAPGRRLSFAVRAIGTATLHATAIQVRYYDVANALLKTTSVAAADGEGYRAFDDDEIPGTCAYFLVVVRTTNTATDKAEVILVAGSTTAGQRLVRRNVPVLSGDALAEGAPVRLRSARGIAPAIIFAPDCSAIAVRDSIVRRGGTLSGTALDVLYFVEERWRFADLHRQLLYTNMFVGDQIIGGQTPLLARAGYGISEVVPGAAAWDQANGACGQIFNTGIIPRRHGFAPNRAAIFAHLLKDQSDVAHYGVGAGTTWGLQFHFGSSFCADFYGGSTARALLPLAYTTGATITKPTRGTFGAARQDDGSTLMALRRTIGIINNTASPDFVMPDAPIVIAATAAAAAGGQTGMGGVAIANVAIEAAEVRWIDESFEMANMMLGRSATPEY